VKICNQQSGIPAGRARSVGIALFEDVGSMLLGCEDRAEPTVLPVSGADAESGVLLGFEDAAEPTVLL